MRPEKGKRQISNVEFKRKGCAMKTLRLAWRNLWRNWKRTAITLAAVTLNMAVLIVTLALMEGFAVQIVGYITNLSTGEAQLHNPEYMEEKSFYDNIKDPAAALAFADEKGIPASARSYGYGLAALGNKSAGARFTGVDPEREEKTFDLAKHLEKGKYLGPAADRGVVLGKKLAKAIEADVGDEIVVLVQAADGSLGNELLTVTGILKTVGDEIDRTAAFMNEKDFEELFASEGRVHEIAFNTRGRMKPEEIKSLFSGKFPDSKVSTWGDLLPALSAMMKVFDQSMVLMCSVFCLAACIGVTNTLLMATYERMREFGTMKALGAAPLRIVGDVAAEALTLAALASVLGLLIGLPICWFLNVHGIDTTRIAGELTTSGIAFDPVWRGVLTLKDTLIAIGLIWLFSVTAALYPAIIAARLNPVDAMRRN